MLQELDLLRGAWWSPDLPGYRKILSRSQGSGGATPEDRGLATVEAGQEGVVNWLEAGQEGVVNWLEAGQEGVVNWLEAGQEGVVNWLEAGQEGVVNWFEAGQEGVVNWLEAGQDGVVNCRAATSLTNIMEGSLVISGAGSCTQDSVVISGAGSCIQGSVVISGAGSCIPDISCIELLANSSLTKGKLSTFSSNKVLRAVLLLLT